MEINLDNFLVILESTDRSAPVCFVEILSRDPLTVFSPSVVLPVNGKFEG